MCRPWGVLRDDRHRATLRPSARAVQADRVAGSLQPGDHATRRNVDARFCIGGISKAFRIGNFGLTAEQADDFFKKPITVLWLAKTRLSETC